jgi:hypothetical protein
LETDRGAYLIIGTRVDSADGLLSGRIGLNEMVIEAPVGLMRSIVIK